MVQEIDLAASNIPVLGMPESNFFLQGIIFSKESLFWPRNRIQSVYYCLFSGEDETGSPEKQHRPIYTSSPIDSSTPRIPSPSRSPLDEEKENRYLLQVLTGAKGPP